MGQGKREDAIVFLYECLGSAHRRGLGYEAGVMQEAIEVLELMPDLARRPYARVSENELRVWVSRHREFTAKDVAEAFGMSRGAVYKRIDQLVEAGIVELANPEAHSTQQRQYRYVSERGSSVAPAGRAHRKEQTRRSGSAPVQGTGKARGKVNPQSAALAEQARANGAAVRKAKHGYLVETDNGITVIAGTPSDHRSLKNAKAALRRIGGL